MAAGGCVAYPRRQQLRLCFPATTKLQGQVKIMWRYVVTALAVAATSGVLILMAPLLWRMGRTALGKEVEGKDHSTR